MANPGRPLNDINTVLGGIAEVAKTIKSTDKKIKAVEKQIAATAAEIDEVESKLMQENLGPRMVDILERKLKRLMDKEAKLMEEKAKLMDEKAKLMDKEAKLMEEKAKLMDEKAKLMDKEMKVIVKVKDAEGSPVSIPATFNFDVASWKPGETINCSLLSEALGPFGGFPETVFVREEMRVVWSIVLDGLTDKPKPSKWVIVGSPGVGKSVLTVLLCFHLAKKFGKAVFLARQLKGEDDAPLRNEVALCFHPNGKVVGFPRAKPSEPLETAEAGMTDDSEVDLGKLSREFQSLHGRPIAVLDGWSQMELDVNSVGKNLGGFNLLATSAQYCPKSQDTRELVLLPVWMERDLKDLWKISGPVGKRKDMEAFKDQIYYSGGSLRELLRSTTTLRNRIDSTIASITEQACKDLLAGYGGSPGVACDRLRRAYLCDNKIGSFTTVRNWCFAVDSSYALRRLSSKAPLDVYTRSLAIAKGTSGESLYGSMFEAFVHHLVSLPRAIITFHVQSSSASGSVAAKGCYEKSICLANVSVECVGGDQNEAEEYLRTRKIDLTQPSYWHPNYPRFPAIDGVLIVPSAKEVHYSQYTAGTTKQLKVVQLNRVHGLVTQSLEIALQAAGGNISEWSFYLHVIAPSQEEAESLSLKPAKIAKDGSLGEMSIGKGFVTYSI
jgi:DNA-binding FrmR family transcriptional regulator